MNKKPSKFYHDLVKMVPLALSDCQYSDAKCKILAEACMTVMGVLDEYRKKRALYVAELNAELDKELLSVANENMSSVQRDETK
jgi:hypothetical protein